MTYKSKYHKYKRKYLDLLGGTYYLNPDHVDPDTEDPDEPDIDPSNLTYEDESEEPTPDTDRVAKNTFDRRKGEITGYNETLVEIVEDPPAPPKPPRTQVRDVGRLGKARGRPVSRSQIPKTDFIPMGVPSDINKILILQTVDDFDSFTTKYGYIPSIDPNYIYIKWDLVADAYKGFYIYPGATFHRDLQIPFHGKTYNSWLQNYDFIDVPIFPYSTSRVTPQNASERSTQSQVIIFEKFKKYELDGKPLIHPFKGKMVDPFAMEDTDFTSLIKTRNPTRAMRDKILLLDTIELFDNFTNIYGSIKTIKNIPQIVIDWDAVALTYGGFYLDKDNSYYNDRYEIAFLKGKKYASWWKMGDISKDIIYIFS